ncbi:hypothetical protein RRF57_001474 [Xylaria bambusicola]|uniref:Uncharacterized protein n=1 Tax=Xylaria bambusicola TaxID=326684 RepID=A0AAN7UCG8_9PEZI
MADIPDDHHMVFKIGYAFFGVEVHANAQQHMYQRYTMAEGGKEAGKVHSEYEKTVKHNSKQGFNQKCDIILDIAGSFGGWQQANDYAIRNA